MISIFLYLAISECPIVFSAILRTICFIILYVAGVAGVADVANVKL